MFLKLLVLFCVIIGIVYVLLSKQLIEDQNTRNMAVLATKLFIVPGIVKKLKKLNPDLTDDQSQQLTKMIGNVATAWSEGKAVRPLLRPIVALVIPQNGDLVAEFADSLLCIFFKESVEQTQHATNKNFVDIDNNVLENLPQLVQEALCAAIASNPVCGITLEDLTNKEGLEKGVSMITQTLSNGKTHVYLYKTEAIERWFRSSQRSINPATNQAISRSSQYFVLS